MSEGLRGRRHCKVGGIKRLVAPEGQRHYYNVGGTVVSRVA